MRILVATDAWRPQLNGVVRTYERIGEEAQKLGAEIAFLTPAKFRTFPAPTYPEIRLAVPGFRAVRETFGAVKPDAVHIAWGPFRAGVVQAASNESTMCGACSGCCAGRHRLVINERSERKEVLYE